MPQRHSVMSDPQDQSALRRINYFSGDGDRLNWYVQLMAKQLDFLSEGELLTLQEEFIALQRTLCGHHTPSKPKLAEMKTFQALVRKHLESLVNNDEISFDFPISIKICLPKA